jgi:zinc and cadmium transporter
MMLIQPLLATIFVSLLSLSGALFLLRKKVNYQKNIPYFVSFAAGVMLAASLLDLLPHAIEEAGIHGILMLTLWGIVGSFLFERFILWHHHHEETHHIKPSALLVLIGDAVHNFIDGVVIAAAFLVNPALGISTTAAIMSHELPQELADFSILLYAGFSRKKALLFNFLSATTALIGTIAGYFLLDQFEEFLPHVLAFTAGMFIYIACADLIPELHREHHEKRENLIKQVLPFLLGIIIMVMIMSLSPKH